MTDNFTPGAAIGFYGLGTDLAFTCPAFRLYWSLFPSPRTGQIGPNAALKEALNNSKIEIVTNDDIPHGSISPVAGSGLSSVQVNNRNGTLAEQAELRRIQAAYGTSLYGDIVSQYRPLLNVNGRTRVMDQSFEIRNFWSVRIQYYAETKLGTPSFFAKGNGRTETEFDADPANFRAMRQNVAGVRTLAQGLRLGGAAHGAYDVHSTGTTIIGQLQTDDTASGRHERRSPDRRTVRRPLGRRLGSGARR